MISIINQLIDAINSYTRYIIDFFRKYEKKKIKIYFLNQLVCTKKVEQLPEINEIFRKIYICKVHKKHLFKTMSTQIVLIPDKILFLDEEKGELHINCVVYEGVGINELQSAQC